MPPCLTQINVIFFKKVKRNPELPKPVRSRSELHCKEKFYCHKKLRPLRTAGPCLPGKTLTLAVLSTGYALHGSKVQISLRFVSEKGLRVQG